MSRNLSEKRILITGSSSGIGRALARQCAGRGAKVALVARSAEPLEELAEQIRDQGGCAIAIAGDITDSEFRSLMLRRAVDEFGGLDILVNNAGVGAFGHCVDLDEATLRQMMEVNFFALAESCRSAIPILDKGNQPLIVNMSSRSGRRGLPAWADYSATKFAVSGFSEALRAELARFDIDLLLVVPGIVNSGFSTRLITHKGRLRLPDNGLALDKAATRIIRAMEGNKKELRMELGARVLLFLNWLAPRFVDWQCARVVRRLYADEIAQRKLEDQPSGETTGERSRPHFAGSSGLANTNAQPVSNGLRESD